MESLFIQEAAPQFEKTAAPVRRLSDNAQTWDNEILAELFRQHSYLGRYTLDLVKRGEEPEGGYLFGHFAVTIPREQPAQQMEGAEVTNPTVEQEQMLGNPVTKIPVIVRARNLFPFDVFITVDGKFLPLNEDRLSESMQQMEPQELGPRQTPMVGIEEATAAPESLPPGRLGSNAQVVSFQEKMSSVSLLDMALHTLQPLVKKAFLERFRTDPELQWSFERNDVFRDAVVKVAQAEPVTAEQIANKIKEAMPADVVQFLPKGKAIRDGLVMKTAAARGYSVVEKDIPGHLIEAVPPEVVNGVIKHGSVTLAVNPRQASLPDYDIRLEHIDEPDSYGVLTKSADALQGIGIPTVIDMSGKPTGLSLFVSQDNQQYALQTKIAGAAIPPGPEVIDVVEEAFRADEPTGLGCFMKSAGAESFATMPMNIGPRVIDSEGNTFYTFSNGMTLGKFAFIEGLQKIAHIKDDMWAIPPDWAWVPLGTRQELMEDGELIEKTAAAEIHHCTVQVSYNGTYKLDGPPVDMLDSGDRGFLKEADARFLLCAVGTDVPVADAVLERAKSQGIAKISVARQIMPMKDMVDDAREKVAVPFLKNLDIHSEDLTKVAAVLSDPESVDAVLSLGFITPDNLQGFVDNMDLLDQSVSRLAEMLIATRIGSLEDIPETALERAVRTTEKTLQGLKALQMRLQHAEQQGGPPPGEVAA